MKGVHGKILVVDLKQQPAVSNRRITGRGLSPLPGRVWTASPPVPRWRMCSMGVEGGFFKQEDIVCQDYCPLAPDKKLGYVLCGRSDTWPAHGLQL
jgi:hypothetical protein